MCCAHDSFTYRYKMERGTAPLTSHSHPRPHPLSATLPTHISSFCITLCFLGRSKRIDAKQRKRNFQPWCVSMYLVRAGIRHLPALIYIQTIAVTPSFTHALSAMLAFNHRLALSKRKIKTARKPRRPHPPTGLVIIATVFLTIARTLRWTRRPWSF